MNRDSGLLLKRWIRLLIMGIVLVAAALAFRKLMKPAKLDQPMEPVYVSVLEIARTHAEERVAFAGTIEPIRDVIVSVEIAGRYTEMPVDVGSDVKEGDVLIKIEDSISKAAYERADAERIEAEKDLQRVSELGEKGGVSASVVDAAAARNRRAQAGVKEAEAWLAKCKVTSPIAGRVEERYVEPGEYALDGNRVFRIADLSKVKVIIFVPEADITDVKEGDTVSFSVSAYPDEVFDGDVTFVARAGDEWNHAFRVELTAENSSGKLRGGMIADVVIRRATKELVAEIPFTAVLPRKGEHIVYLWKDGRAVRRTVRIHAQAGENALISSGLEDGEYVVVEGQKFLQDGKRVVVKGITRGE